MRPDSGTNAGAFYSFQFMYLCKVRPAYQNGLAVGSWFQPTYLYKIRLQTCSSSWDSTAFQPTYLYKIRHTVIFICVCVICFNPRTSIRYDTISPNTSKSGISFQPTYLYKIRPMFLHLFVIRLQFQPTYLYKIRLSV